MKIKRHNTHRRCLIIAAESEKVYRPRRTYHKTHGTCFTLEERITGKRVIDLFLFSTHRCVNDTREKKLILIVK